MTEAKNQSCVKVGLLQYAMGEVCDRDGVLEKVCGMIREAAGMGAEVVVLPELCLWPYFCREQDPQYFDWAEEVPGATTKVLQGLADELGVVIHVAVFEKRAAGLYHNTSVTLEPGGRELQLYRKMHIPHDPSFEEKYYFTPGGEGEGEQESFVVHKASNLKIGPLICWDQWYPEAARIVAMKGAELLVYPTAIGYLDGERAADQKAQREAWMTMQKSHAIANNVYVAGCNRVGREGELVFWGSSFVVGPDGVVIGEMGEEEEGVLIVEVDKGKIEEQRRWWPFFRDRRVDQYQTILKRWADEK
ncbi:N-carbamoyl-D-amino acid hydrolase [Poriferisphaera corsica]|uniref:N-carbamoyl-D-amino acid hydrolase n=1 Tax=Poriferisphaera corsica TaxID=2528020 RepID=A0A517YYU1_9BACT|nr:carbon-nitrogen hydrolase [Poriferisphaera corsica]QDU35400.1 N-carbamoyl-D-amino acid hydrolase [Poriferisphaera corsica]